MILWAALFVGCSLALSGMQHSQSANKASKEAGSAGRAERDGVAGADPGVHELFQGAPCGRHGWLAEGRRQFSFCLGPKPGADLDAGPSPIGQPHDSSAPVLSGLRTGRVTGPLQMVDEYLRGLFRHTQMSGNLDAGRAALNRDQRERIAMRRADVGEAFSGEPGVDGLGDDSGGQRQQGRKGQPRLWRPCADIAGTRSGWVAQIDHGGVIVLSPKVARKPAEVMAVACTDSGVALRKTKDVRAGTITASPGPASIS